MTGQGQAPSAWSPGHRHASIGGRAQSSSSSLLAVSFAPCPAGSHSEGPWACRNSSFHYCSTPSPYSCFWRPWFLCGPLDAPLASRAPNGPRNPIGPAAGQAGRTPQCRYLHFEFLCCPPPWRLGVEYSPMANGIDSEGAGTNPWVTATTSSSARYGGRVRRSRGHGGGRCSGKPLREVSLPDRGGNEPSDAICTVRSRRVDGRPQLACTSGRYYQPGRVHGHSEQCVRHREPKFDSGSVFSDRHQESGCSRQRVVPGRSGRGGVRPAPFRDAGRDAVLPRSWSW